MKLIVTIDTEEDEWGKYSAQSYAVSNIFRIPLLQELLNKYRVTPTYLVTYPVATSRPAVSILKEILESGRCEIGAHCHPWNTPPVEEERTVQNSMLFRLGPELRFQKLQTLDRAITESFGMKATSFRAGRWGYDLSIAQQLIALGYTIDTSVTPYTDWTDWYGPDYSKYSPEPFWVHANEDVTPHPTTSSNARLLEVPTTVGFQQSNFERAASIFLKLQKRTMQMSLLYRVLAKCRLVNYTWLSPENSTANEMIALTKQLKKRGTPFVNLMFHSPNLVAGLTPFVRTKAEEQRFLVELEKYLDFASGQGIESISLNRAVSQIDSTVGELPTESLQMCTGGATQ